MSATDMPFERLEALLRGEEPRTLDEKQRASMLSELRAGTLDAPETLRQSVLAAAPGAARRRRTSMPRRRLVLVVVPVAACLAVGAALIHGAFSSGSNPLAANVATRSVFHGKAKFQQNLKAVTHAPAANGAFAKAHTTAGKAFGTPTAAQSKGTLALSDQTAKRVPNAPRALGPLAGDNPVSTVQAYSAVTIPSNRLVHADASMQVVVKDHAALTSATNNATQIVTRLGGYAQSVQYQASRKGYGNAYLDLRVPVGKAETAIGRLGALGQLSSQQVSTQDLQQQFRQQTDTIGSLKRAIAIYQQALNSGSVSGSQRVEVQIRLSSAEHALNSQRKARSHTVASAATADIQLTLTTNQHAFVTVHHKQGRLGRLLGNAGNFLGLEGIIVLYALIVASPFVILGGLGWGLARERRRRGEKALLGSA